MRENLRFVSPRDRVLFLRALPIFEGVSTSDLMLIAQHHKEVHFKRGDVIFEAGEPIEAAYMLVEGRVQLERNGEKIGEIEAPTPLAFVGILGGLDGMPGKVTASTDVLALSLSKEAIMHIWEENFDLLVNSLRLAATRLWEERGRWPYAHDREVNPETGEYPEERLTLVDLIQWQRNFGPFEGVNLEAVAEVARNQREVRYPAGTVLWSQGDPSGFFLRIAYGLVRIEQEGREQAGQVGYDWSIGFMEGVAQLPRGYTAIAETEVVAIRSEMEMLLSIMEDQFELAMRSLRALSWFVAQRLWQTGEYALLSR